MKLILSTSNIMSSGQALMRRPVYSKSNVELLNSLNSNFAVSRHSVPHKSDGERPQESGRISWTTQDGDTLYVPSWRAKPLAEPRESYDITAKLFYLPGVDASRRCQHTRDAIDMVLKELGVKSIDLLIISYPGISFDADDDGEEELSADEFDSDSDESLGHDAQLKTWRVLESLHDEGVVSQLGLSDFSSDRLAKFLPEVRIKPSVDQINVRDCCVVPKPLILYAKENKIELLTHADCTDILPPGTTRELLGTGDKGAGIIAARADAPDSEPGLKGDIAPQWVIKYTAVVKNRGVIENKGYFAVAQLGSCIEDKPLPVS